MLKINALIIVAMMLKAVDGFCFCPNLTNTLVGMAALRGNMADILPRKILQRQN